MSPSSPAEGPFGCVAASFDHGPEGPFLNGEEVELRRLATPFVIISFLAVGFTGCCLLLGIRTGFVNQLHEWSSLAFVAGSVLHIVVHRGPTLAQLRKPLVAVLAVCALAVSILAVLPIGSPRAGGRQVIGRLLDTALDSNLGTIAVMTRQPEDVVFDRLSRAGFGSLEPGATLREIARANHKDPMDTLAAVLAEGAQPGDKKAD